MRYTHMYVPNPYCDLVAYVGHLRRHRALHPRRHEASGGAAAVNVHLAWRAWTAGRVAVGA